VSAREQRRRILNAQTIRSLKAPDSGRIDYFDGGCADDWWRTNRRDSPDPFLLEPTASFDIIGTAP
jgi:hypothetical protein